MTTKKFEEFYPRSVFNEAYSPELYKFFKSEGLNLLKQGYPLSEIHDILEKQLLIKESKLTNTTL